MIDPDGDFKVTEKEFEQALKDSRAKHDEVRKKVASLAGPYPASLVRLTLIVCLYPTRYGPLYFKILGGKSH
jgi:predicted urease superfamily metal-dependent hydrolase